MFFEQLDMICKKQNTSVTSVINAIGLSKGNIRNWKNGITPKYETRLAIANYLGISIDLLLTDDEKKQQSSSSLDININDIRYAAYKELEDVDEDEIKDVIDFIRYKKSQKKKD